MEGLRRRFGEATSRAANAESRAEAAEQRRQPRKRPLEVKERLDQPPAGKAAL